MKKWNISACVLIMVLLATSLLSGQTARALSDKDLFKRAQTEEKGGNIDAAYLSVKEARAKKNKPDKNYDELFGRLAKQLADREAAKGEAACKNSDLVLCENQLKMAKGFSATPGVERLQSTFDRQLSELHDNFSGLLRVSVSDPDRAFVEMNSLKKFIAHLPDLTSQIERIRVQAVNAHLSAGAAALGPRKWDEANTHFNRVLELVPGDPRATSGLKDTVRLKDAYKLQDEAMTALESKNYQVALQQMDLAMKAAPDIEEFKQKRQLVADGWTAALVDRMERLLDKPDDPEQTRDAYLNLEQLRVLNGSHPKVKEFSRTVNENFGATLLLRATDLEKVSDFSRIATAAISKAKARELLSTGSVKIEEMKEVFDYFNKRRAAQLLISSEDLSGTDPVFIQTVTLRAKSASENAGLPDLRVRSLADYEKQPDEDPIVKGLLLDGTSSTVLLTVAVNRHENLKKQGTARSVKSQFNAGTRMVPNPLYSELSAQLEFLRKDLADEKKKKEWPTIELNRQLKQAQLEAVTQSLPETQTANYEYREVPWEQDIVIEVTLTLRDYITRQIVFTPPPILVSQHNSDVEITGVHKDDSQGLQNRPPTKIADNAIKEIERQVLERITTLTAEMLPRYTRRFFEDAEGKKTRDVDGAVEGFISHWAFFRGKIDKKELDYISAFVQMHTGYSIAEEGGRLFQAGLITTAAIR